MDLAEPLCYDFSHLWEECLSAEQLVLAHGRLVLAGEVVDWDGPARQVGDVPAELSVFSLLAHRFKL